MCVWVWFVCVCVEYFETLKCYVRNAISVSPMAVSVSLVAVRVSLVGCQYKYVIQYSFISISYASFFIMHNVIVMFVTMNYYHTLFRKKSMALKHVLVRILIGKIND